MAKLQKYLQSIKTRTLVLFLLVFACTAAFAAVQLANGLQPYSSAGEEYAVLRSAYRPQTGTSDNNGVTTTDPTESLIAINPDYIGWLEIAGTDISYPMVQGEDNDKYLSTTFEGAENKLGAIFLDARCTDGLASPHAIIYGHNSKDGSMFGSLAQLLKQEVYPDITITLPDGTAHVYKIFAVRESDIGDPAYRLDFEDDAALSVFASELGAPENTAQLLTLSTCTNSGDRNTRLIVHAAPSN